MNYIGYVGKMLGPSDLLAFGESVDLHISSVQCIEENMLRGFAFMQVLYIMY